MPSGYLVYLNGNFQPASQAAIPLTDAGFLWGATITDRLRTFRQKLFRLDDHLKRFRQSCELACVRQPRTDAELAEIASEVIEANAKFLSADTELSLVIFATPGSAPESPTLGMQAFEIATVRYRHLFEIGAVLEPVPAAVPSDILNPHIKHRSRLAWWVAKDRTSPGREPLFTTGKPECFIRETAVANFLAVIDGTIVSPPRPTILNGVSLLVVEELCDSLGIPFSEREMAINDVVARGGECLLSNTTLCLCSVGRIGNVEKMANGPIFGKLLQAWSDLVGVDIRRQFSGNP